MNRSARRSGTNSNTIITLVVFFTYTVFQSQTMAATTLTDNGYPSAKELTFGIEYEFLVHINITDLSEEEKRTLTADFASSLPRHTVRLMADAIRERLDALGLQHAAEVTDMLTPSYGGSGRMNERV